MDIIGDIADPKVQALFKKHWPWFVAGGIGVIALGYMYFAQKSAAGSTSTTSTTGTSAPDANTQLNDSTQLQLASLTAGAQTAMATIAASQAVQTQDIITGGENYQTLVNATAVQNNTMVATAAQQNEQMASTLSTGFSNYVVSTAQIATAEASATANVASANDAANGSNVLGQTLAGIGSVIGNLNASTALNAGIAKGL